MNLYELPAEFAGIEQSLDTLLAANVGEITPEVESLEAQLKTLLMGGAAKLEGAAMVVKNLLAQSEACKAEAARLSSRAASFVNQAASLKALMGYALEAVYNGKVKTARFTIFNKANPTSYEVTVAPDVDLLKVAEAHPGLVKVEASVRSKELAELFKAGKALPAGLAVAERPKATHVEIR